MNQKEFERDVFGNFAEVASFVVVPDSIVSCDPPRPDILCEIEGTGTAGFELTELIDAGFRERLDLMAKTQQYLSDYWRESLCVENSQKFKLNFSNALLHFVYRENVGFIARRRISAAIFERLLMLPENCEGDFLKDDERLGSLLEEIRVSRGIFQGPILDVDAAGYLGNPVESTLTNKMSKVYDCNYPLFLLAHIEIDLLPPGDAWHDAAEQASKLLPASQFLKFWVFDRTSEEIRYIAELPK